MRQQRTVHFAVNIATSWGCTLLALFVVTMSPRTVQASWAYVPQEIRMAEADLVVAGKVEKLGEDVEKNGTVYEVGIIKPSMILRGKPKTDGVIRLAWPSRWARSSAANGLAACCDTTIVMLHSLET